MAGMRFRLRTLIILLAILPPLIAVGWSAYLRFRPREAPSGAGWTEIVTGSVNGTAIGPDEVNNEVRRIYWVSRRKAD
jgi:hypothetical protein